MTTLNDIVDVVITRSSRTPSRRGFGNAMIAAHHTAWLDRSRTYADPSDMLDDGFTSKHPAYVAAVSLMSQNPRPKRFKIGRRAGAPDQTLRFTPSTPVAGEVYSVTVDGVVFEVTADASPSVAEITAAFALLMNIDVDAIIATGGVSAAAQQVYETTELNGVIGQGTIAPARNVTLVLNAHADWDATTAVVVGLDATGSEQTEDLAIPNGGGTTVVGTKLFSKVTSLTIPAQTGTNGTFTMGVGVDFGTELDVTTTDNTTSFDISADVAGTWFAYEDVSANLTVEDRTTEPATTLATDLAAIKAADTDWFGLVVADAQSKAQILAAAAWIEAEERMYFAHSMDSACTTNSSTDVGSEIESLARLNTTVIYNSKGHSFPDAALWGVLLPLDPGSVQAQYKALSGVAVDTLSETQQGFLDAKKITYYIELAGLNVTIGGLTGGGEWIDIMQGIYYLHARMRESVFGAIAAPPKLPYTNGGIDVVVGTTRGVLVAASEPPRNLIDPTSITVEAPTVDEIDPADRQARLLPDVVWDARVQGAIVKVRSRGTIRP